MGSSPCAAVYLTDGNNNQLTFTSIASLGLNQSSALDVHVTQAGFSKPVPESLLKFMQSRGHRLSATSIVPAKRIFKERPHITSTAFAKLEAIKSVASDYRKVFYFDTDVLFMRQLDLNILMSPESPMVAVPDLSTSTAIDEPRFFENCQSHALAPRYFNAGMLGFDTSWFLSSGYIDRYEAALIAHQDYCEYRGGPCHNMDQCPLNMAALGEWQDLPLAYNVQKAAFQTKLWKDAIIRHFTGKDKFLPAIPHRFDRAEALILKTIATTCPDLGIKVPYRYGGLAYWMNARRRQKSRDLISVKLNEYFPELL